LGGVETEKIKNLRFAGRRTVAWSIPSPPSKFLLT